MSEIGYPFYEVFPEITNASNEIKNLTVKNASLRRESNVLYLRIKENLSSDIFSELKSVLSTAYGVKDVEIESENAVEDISSEKISDSSFSDESGEMDNEKVEKYERNETDSDTACFSGILKNVISKSPPVASLLNEASFAVEDNTVIITLTKGGKKYLDERGVTKYFSSRMREKTGKPFEVVYDGTVEVEKILTDEEISVLSTVQKPKSDNSGEKVILGNNIMNRPIVMMNTVNEDTGRVCVEGDIFKVETRETRDKSRLRATVYITDYTSSIAVKLEDFTEKLSRVIEKIPEGTRVRIRGMIRFDRYFGDIVLYADDIMTVPKVFVMDTAPEKRVELHLHTNMSSMDGINEIGDYVKRAASWGHKAIAVTDHGVVQSYPAAAAAAAKNKIKMIYGVENYLVNDIVSAFVGDAKASLKDEFIVFDIETTGTSFGVDRITEIAAVIFKEGNIIEEFQTFCNPEKEISVKIQNLTGITNEMVADAPKEAEAVRMFLEFCGGRIVVAHNAAFDTGFISAACKRNGIEYNLSHIDTIPLCRKFYPDIKNSRLNTVAQHLGYGDFRHHRAIDDTRVLSAIFGDLLKRLAEAGITDTDGFNDAIKGMNTKAMHRFHQVLLVKNLTGLKNLYKLVSRAHIDNFYYQPRIKKSELNELREGLIVGSACVEGELYRAFLEMRSREEILEIAKYYDYFEIQPVANNEFLIDDADASGVNSKDDIRAINKKIVELGEELGKPVVATGDVHFLDPSDTVFREIIMDANGFNSFDTESELYFRTTDNMLEEFSYLGEEKAFEVVVTNTNKIADMVEDGIIPIPEGTFTPSIEGAETSFRESTYNKAHEIYGEVLPEIVEKRLDREVNSIIDNGFSVMYASAQRIVAFSNENGYTVGSRGSVGSSFAATMAGITEINPLPPHYICKSCRHSEFITDGSVKSGFELEEKPCPKCGAMMIGDGHDIPFETFLGFHGEKAPDIDLNISGEFQTTVHRYVETLFGKEYCFKAGTISLVKDKTAKGYVRKYLEKRGKRVSNAEIERLATGATGVKRTTGQHPGGIVVVPKGYEIYDFTPVQRPADKSDSTIITTHFDFNSMHDTLLKLDLLGHDVPTLARHLTDLTGISFTEVPINDKKVMSLFTSPEALGVDAKQIYCETGTLGLPEMGTPFVRQMLIDAQPKTFSDLLQISGLSHGTNVWLGNAQDLIKNGICTISEVIGTRDDIMVYLMYKGLPSDRAFSIMEKVRKKNKTLSEDDEKLMREHNVPDWYLDSCKKIEYMFPKAHAAAYVMGAIRLGWYKVYRPKEFYAALFTVRPDGFDAEIMSNGINGVRKTREDLLRKSQETGKPLSANDDNLLGLCEQAIEMMSRGINFLPIHVYKSHPYKFLVEEEGIRLPFIAVAGLGESAAKALSDARDAEAFSTQEDIKKISGISKSIVEAMDKLGAFEGIPKSSQLTFF